MTAQSSYPKNALRPLISAFTAIGICLSAAPSKSLENDNSMQKFGFTSFFVGAEGVLGDKILNNPLAGHFNVYTDYNRLNPYGTLEMGSTINLGEIANTGLSSSFSPVLSYESAKHAAMTSSQGTVITNFGGTFYAGGEYAITKKFSDFSIGSFVVHDFSIGPYAGVDVSLLSSRSHWTDQNGDKGSNVGGNPIIGKMGVKVGLSKNVEFHINYYNEAGIYYSIPNPLSRSSQGWGIRGLAAGLRLGF